MTAKPKRKPSARERKLEAALADALVREERLSGLLRALVKGIDDWNEAVRGVIGRQPNYQWGALEAAREALRQP